MPTADGRFLGISVPAYAWDRIFRKNWICPECGPTNEVVFEPDKLMSPYCVECQSDVSPL